MTNKQQIDEMEKILNDVIPYPLNCTFSFYGKTLAEALYNAGYRKIDENAVVLTREEHKQMFKDLIASNKVIEAETRKETAKEIFQCLYNRYKNMVKSGTRALPLETMGMPIIKKLAKQYGVEVEDNGN